MKTLLLITAISVSACACACASLPHEPVAPLSTRFLALAAPETGPWAGVEITLHRLTAATLAEHPAYALRVLDERTGVVRFFSRVPLPAYEIEITNRNDKSLTLDAKNTWLLAKTTWLEPVIDREDLDERAREQARHAADLYAIDRGTLTSLDGFAHPTADVALLGEATTIEPGATWSGALVVATSSAHTDALRDAARDHQLAVRLGGGHFVDRSLPPLALEFVDDLKWPGVLRCLDGRYVDSPEQCGEESTRTGTSDGACIQEGTGVGLRDRFKMFTFMAGEQVTRTDVSSLLLSRGESRRHEARATRLRGVGWALLGGGLLGAVGTAGGLAMTGHRDISPLGLSALGGSAIGIALLSIAEREHRLGVREFNDVAFRADSCSPPPRR